MSLGTRTDKASSGPCVRTQLNRTGTKNALLPSSYRLEEVCLFLVPENLAPDIKEIEILTFISRRKAGLAKNNRSLCRAALERLLQKWRSVS